MEIAPLRGLRYRSGGEVAAPPYDVIAPAEHRRLLDASEHNITRLTLGSEPGGTSDYEARAALLRRWIEEGALAREEKACFYVNTVDYAVPGTDAGGRRARFVGLVALGKLHELAERIVLPHEQTFPKVVEDRYRLLQATRTHLESILLLYSDRDGAVDEILLEHSGGRNGEAVALFEPKPGEKHALYRIEGAAEARRLEALLRPQRPIIADGHHRYTTALRYRREAGASVPGSGWQLMTFANLFSDGLSILATHRLVKLRTAAPAAALLRLATRLEVVDESGRPPWELLVETRESRIAFRFPKELRAGRSAAGRTAYALLHDVVLGEWLKEEVNTGGARKRYFPSREDLGPASEKQATPHHPPPVEPLGGESGIRYFKEETGEDEALSSGEGDLLFRLPPVGRDELQAVVEGGEVLPHKTTYFYPKLGSGLVLWPLEEPVPAPGS